MKKTVPGNLLVALVAVSYMGILSLSCDSGTVGDTPTVGGGTGGSTSPTTINLSNGGATGTSAGANGGSTSPGDITCGTTTRETSQLPADILIVLDRSESMNYSLTANQACSSTNTPGSTCSTRLDAVVPAVQTVVTDNPNIHWGLELFSSPGGNSCSVSSTPQVLISADSSAAIKSQLAALTTQTSTPTRLAITTATAYLNTVTDGNNKAILLASDGLPNCASGAASSSGADDLSGTEIAVEAAKNAGIPVYVIGIGPATSVSNLNQLAVAGGTGSYYPATSTTELATALTKIAKAASTCTFKSDTAPQDSSLVYVYVDKNLVTKDDSEGWKFDPTDSTSSTIVLTGSTCTDLMDGKTSQVQIVFGCPGTSPAKVIY
jgi:hypothetical protein